MSNEATKLVNPINPGDLRPPSEPEPTNLPDELKGKSFEEAAKAYADLKSKIGRQGNEIGELRKALEARVATPSDPEEDFLDNPEAKVASAIDAKLTPLVAQNFDATLDRERPHWKDTVQSEEFADWVLASKVRKTALAQAQAFDTEAAIELLDMWDAHNGLTEEQASERAASAVKQDRRLRAASTEAGSTPSRGGKVYSRAWIRDLRQRNPKAYSAQLPEIRKAYAEGRTTE